MTDSDRKTFGTSLAILAEVFGEQMSTLKLEAYYDALTDYRIEEIQEAVRRTIKHCRFFPRPVELIEEIWAMRRLARSEFKALVAPDPTEEERLDIEQAMRDFRKVAGDAVAESFTKPHMVKRHLRTVTTEEVQAHEARKAAELERLRISTPPPAEASW